MKLELWSTATAGAPDEAALRQQLEAQGYRVTRQVYRAGTVFESHRHESDKVDAVISGRLRFTGRGGSVVLGPGDAVRVPRGMLHRAEVVGGEAVVSLDATRDPGWP